MPEPRIASVVITPMPKTLFDPMPVVYATFDDGTEEALFSYYPDEIQFTEQEFLGLTRQEAKALFVKRDKLWLQS